jgi:hypothetical protein
MEKRSASYSGKVVRHRWSTGSKSEHDAICLQTEHGLVKLRRAGGHPFHDPDLEKLVGMNLDVEGTMLESATLLITSWKPASPD